MNISKNNLLALDPATQCGWATNGECGVWDLSTRADESNGMKWLRFRSKLQEICRSFPILVVAYERPAGRHANAVIHHAKMAAIIEEFCADHELEYRAYSALEMKKLATGRGNASKEQMLAAAVEKLQYTGCDHNEADALWILEKLSLDLGVQ